MVFKVLSYVFAFVFGGCFAMLLYALLIINDDSSRGHPL